MIYETPRRRITVTSSFSMKYPFGNRVVVKEIVKDDVNALSFEHAGYLVHVFKSVTVTWSTFVRTYTCTFFAALLYALPTVKAIC